MAAKFGPWYYLSLLIVCFVNPQSSIGLNPLAQHNNCAVHIAQYEKQHNIPEGLLHAISKVESGRKDDTGRIVAWPWTINAEGKGFFFASKAEAIAAVLKMQQEGVKSIDVGCMQVNLYYHPKAFSNLSDAFDPVKNVAYAAKFLSGLKNEHASWHTAVAHYHSANPVHHIPYRKTVLNVWNKDIKSGNISLAAGVFENFQSVGFEPSIDRIRRLSNSPRINSNRVRLDGNKVIKAGLVRRVERGATSRLKRYKLNRS